MKTTFRMVVLGVCLSLFGCRSTPTNVIVRLEGDLPQRWLAQKMTVRLDYAFEDGRQSIITAVIPSSRFGDQ